MPTGVAGLAWRTHHTHPQLGRLELNTCRRLGRSLLAGTRSRPRTLCTGSPWSLGWAWAAGPARLKVTGETRAPSPWGGHPWRATGASQIGAHGREARHRRHAGLIQDVGREIPEPGVPGLWDAMGAGLEDGHGALPPWQLHGTETLPRGSQDPPLDLGPSDVARQPGPEPQAVAPPSQCHASWRVSITAHSVAATHTHRRGTGSHWQGPCPRRGAGRQQAEASPGSPSQE